MKCFSTQPQNSQLNPDISLTLYPASWRLKLINMHNPPVERLGAAHSSKRQFRPYNIIVILTMCFASLSLGYCLNVISSTLAQPSFISYFHLDTRPDATSILSTTNGVFQAGAFFGACSISYVGDHLGRKWGIAIPLVLVVISGAGLAGSVSMAMFIVFRFIAGCGGFWLLGAVPVWMTEIVPPRNRGLLVDLHSASLLLGYTCASWMGYAWFHLETDNVSTPRLAINSADQHSRAVWTNLLNSPRILLSVAR